MRAGRLARWLPSPVRIALRRWWRGRGADEPASTEYRLIEEPVDPELLRGFADPAVAARQQAAFEPLMRELRAGRPREDFRALAAAVQRTGLARPRVVEVGCGSGWNAEVLERLAGPIRYVGIDYAPAMLALARRAHPTRGFVLADAAHLPLRDGAAEILISGTVLMHLLHYREAVRESRRVAGRWCVFHTVPVLASRPTTRLAKRAYGSPTIEIIFNEGELRDLLAASGLRVRETFPSIPYDLEDILGERTVTRTYLCEVDAGATPR